MGVCSQHLWSYNCRVFVIVGLLVFMSITSNASSDAETPSGNNATTIDITPLAPGGALHHLLSEYDILRKPRWVDSFSDFERITKLSESGLSDEVFCPICRGVYRHVVVVKDCLHRFCSECIEKWLRAGKQDCPQCRIRIASRRALRHDPIFDQLVCRLFPNIMDFEGRNDELIYKSNKRRSLRLTVDSGLTRDSRRPSTLSEQVLSVSTVVPSTENANEDRFVDRCRMGHQPGKHHTAGSRQSKLSRLANSATNESCQDEVLTDAVDDNSPDAPPFDSDSTIGCGYLRQPTEATVAEAVDASIKRLRNRGVHLKPKGSLFVGSSNRRPKKSKYVVDSSSCSNSSSGQIRSQICSHSDSDISPSH